MIQFIKTKKHFYFFRLWKSFSFIFLCLIFFLAIFFAFEPIVDKSVKADNLNYQKTPINKKLGMNDLGWTFDPTYNNDEQFKEGWNYQLSMIKKLPLKYIRIGTYYSLIKTNTSGNYNFDRLDYAIRTAQNQGLRVIMPIWADLKITDTYTGQLAETKDMITKLVQHEKNKRILWEGIDEAETGGSFWFGKKMNSRKLHDVILTDRYYQYIVKKYDPDSHFISGDLAGNNHNANYIIRNGIFKPRTNFGSFHAYENKNPEKVLKDWNAKVIKRLRKNGIKPAITELGYPYPNDFNGHYSRKQQSDYLLREIFCLDMQGVKVIAPFCMEDTNHQWGLEYSRFSKQKGKMVLAGKNMQRVFNQLKGYSFAYRLNSNFRKNGDYVLVYAKTHAPLKYVYWTTKNANSQYIGNTKIKLTNSPKIKKIPQIFISWLIKLARN